MSKPFIIAELGQAHEGSLGIAHSYIDALATTGVDAVKFQTHIADAESSVHEPFRVKFSYEDDKRIDYWRRMEFTPEQWVGLKAHCEEKGMEFISSPFSNAAVELLEKLEVKRYKIGSGEVSNFLMLALIAKTKKPIIVSSGMSSFEELDQTIDFLKEKESPISILQCTTAYPTQPHEWGLNVIQELKDRYQVPVGFSDHSGDIFACLAATTLGADLLEFHVVFDKRMFGPDARSSLTIDQTKRLVDGIRQIRSSLDAPIDKTDNSKYSTLKSIFEKSLAVNKDLPKGTVLTIDDLETKKPKGLGINASEFRDVIGKQLNTDKKKNDFLTNNNLL
ncbi:MAG: N-acetylneuraminate synthase family protein [Flammeovirgaceae bacterium]